MTPRRCTGTKSASKRDLDIGDECLELCRRAIVLHMASCRQLLGIGHRGAIDTKSVACDH